MTFHVLAKNNGYGYPSVCRIFLNMVDMYRFIKENCVAGKVFSWENFPHSTLNLQSPLPPSCMTITHEYSFEDDDGFMFDPFWAGSCESGGAIKYFRAFTNQTCIKMFKLEIDKLKDFKSL